jgi:hypothetical protein
MTVRKNSGWKAWFTAAVGAGLSAGVLWVGASLPRREFLAPAPAAPASSLTTLLSFQIEELPEMDVARVNLLCAGGLPGGEDCDLQTCLRTLDEMARRVERETARHQYRFQRNQSEFENSEGFFRILMMMVVLAEDFGVRYNLERPTSPSAGPSDGFFADSRDVFLHGLLGPRRTGTCSSLPVLYVAIGRRLGYPLKLVTTKGHLFARWEDARERFNIEVTGNGLNHFGDDYYRQWPFAVTDAEVKAEGYLKSLTPAEELAAFLSIRGMCLREAGRKGEAAEAFAAASRLAPNCRSYRAQQRALAFELGANRQATRAIRPSTRKDTQR